MGRYIPKEAAAVDAFQWNQRSPSLVGKMIAYLRENDTCFELFGMSGTAVSIIVGDDDDNQVRVDHNCWLVVEDGEFKTYDTSTFYEKYRAAD